MEKSVCIDDISLDVHSVNVEDCIPQDVLAQEEQERSLDIEQIMDNIYDHGDTDKSLEFEPIVHSTPVRSRSSTEARDLLGVINLYVQGCCAGKCINNLSPNEIMLCEGKFKERGDKSMNQQQFILDKLVDHCDPSKSEIPVCFVIYGKSLCSVAWKLVHDIPDRIYNRAVSKFQEGKRTLVHGKTGHKWELPKTKEAIGWMSAIFNRIGDKMPHKDKLILPITYDKTSLYKRMVAESATGEVITYQHFCSLWMKNHSNVEIGKGNDFAVCSTCHDLTEQLQKTLLEKDKRELRGMKKEHDEYIEQERHHYYEARAKARDSPHELTCIIIDGMDQSKTNLPHLVQKTKDTSSLERMRTHITGCFLHTDVPGGCIPYAFIDYHQFPHDTNLTLNTLLDVLLKNKERLGRYLHLQLDNCGRENKNKFVLGFCALLVHLGIFEEVTLNFLPVGHTHEDIDQGFSRISIKIRKSNVYFIEGFKDLIATSYTPAYNVFELLSMMDIRAWLSPHLPNIKYHSGPHYFRFRKYGGIVKMHYRDRVKSDWQPRADIDTASGSVDSTGDGLIILESIPDMTTVPEWVEPIPERVNLPALKVALPHQYGERIPEHDRIKWSEFLESAQKRILEVPDSKPSTWDLATLAEFANNRRVETTDVSPGVSSIMRKMTKTMRTVEVVPKKKKRQLATANDIVNTLVSGGNEEEVQMEEDIHLEVQEEIGVHVEEVEEFDITIDSIVAFYDERESARPCLGHVVEVKTEDDITWMNLHLLQGGYKKAFKLAQNGVGKNRKPVMQWFDVKAAICWNIVLTKANRLSPQMVKYLQALYSELEDGHSSD